MKISRVAALAAVVVCALTSPARAQSADPDLERRARAVLDANRKTTTEDGVAYAYTCPDPKKYPYQWLWDSCFHAIGLRWSDPARARAEIDSLLAAQWDNGMVPNLCHVNGGGFAPRLTRLMQRAGRNSSGITQPPIVAQTVLKVDEVAPDRAFLERAYPRLARYHDWLSRERDPRGEGLPIIYHPWESGVDDSPRWDPILGIQEFHRWRYNITKFRLLVSFARRDFDGRKMGDDAPFLARGIDMACYQLVDLEAMAAIAAKLGKPEEAARWRARAQATRTAILARMYNPRTGMFCDLIGGDARQSDIRTPFGLMPLYAGLVDGATARRFAALMEDPKVFGTRFPIPSVAADAPQFDPRAYWRGTVWINVPWFLVQGLRRYGLHAEADRLTARTLELVRTGGFAEYFDPLTGEGLGAQQFGWTAALALDLLHR